MPVGKIFINKGKAKGVVARNHLYEADLVISGADYHHTETLMMDKYRNYTGKYWNKRVMAPSALLFYIAFNKKLKNISHHTLFFDADFDSHADKIFDNPGWPDRPLFYASFPSQTDLSMAPENRETAIILVPLASGLVDSEEKHRQYLDQIIERMEEQTNQSLREDILFYKTYSINDFEKDFNAYKGNAYGLSNILMQTAFLKPKVYNKKIKNLFYTGQLTVPGPGVPTTIISGKIAAEMAVDYFNKN